MAEQATDPRGRCFISYRRTRRHEVALVLQVLHEYGIKTWRDLEDLAEEPTEAGLRDVIKDPTTACGLIWITPDIKDRPLITNLEIPQLVERQQRGDSFFLIPVAVGGADYFEAADVALSRVTLNDFSTWNVIRIKSNPATPTDTAEIARRILRRRLAAVQAWLPPDQPIIVDVFTRTPVVQHSDATLTINLTHHFHGRTAAPTAWQDRVIPAFESVVTLIAQQAPRRTIQLRGLTALAAATALGATLSATRGIPAEWIQRNPDGSQTPYTLAAARQTSGYTIVTNDADHSARDLAILVNVTQDPVPALRATTNLPRFRATIHATPPTTPPHTFTQPGHVTDLAHAVVAEVRATRTRYGQIGDIHLFIAGPSGLAFLVGQLLNTLGPIRTYEHIPDDGVGHYEIAAVIRPAT